MASPSPELDRPDRLCYLDLGRPMNIPEILKKCSALESDVASIYRKFAGLFPDTKDLWDDLAAEEDGHTAVLIFASKYAEKGKLPSVLTPELLTHLEGTVDMVAAVNRMIREESLSLDEALGIALNLEQTVHENYLHDLMSLDTDSEVLKHLQLIATETESHVARINDLIEKRRV